jgi:hypothetical protein
MTDDRYTSIERLFVLARYVEIAHHVPGRIRSRVLPSEFGIVHEFDMTALVPGVLEMRANVAADHRHAAEQLLRGALN